VTAGEQVSWNRAVLSVAARFNRGAAFGLPFAAGLAIFLLLATAFFGILDDVRDAEGITAIDAPVLEAFRGWRTEPGTAVARLATTVGSPPGVALTGLAVGAALAYRRRRWHPLVVIAVTWAGTAASGTIVKILIGRARPSIELAITGVSAHGHAFPSGHASISMAVYVMAALLVSAGRPLAHRALVVAVAGAAAVAVGLSRVYLGVHWPTDVLASWTMALGYVAVVSVAAAAWRTAGPLGSSAAARRGDDRRPDGRRRVARR
jgi:membrane-associated phospholipid phosphatase